MDNDLEPTYPQDIVSERVAEVCASRERSYQLRLAMADLIGAVAEGDIRIVPQNENGTRVARMVLVPALKELADAAKLREA